MTILLVAVLQNILKIEFKVTCTEEATETAAKYLQNNMCFK